MKNIKLIGVVLSILFYTNISFSQGADCLLFDGNNDYIEANNTSLNAIGTGDFTFEAWISGDLAGQNAHPAIFSNRPVPGTGTMFLFHNNWGGSAYKMLCVQLAGLNYFVFDNGTFNASFFDGTCHHVAITRQGMLLTFYADGVAFGTRVIGGASPTVGSAAELWIGQDSPTNNTFNGNISQVRIWNDTRTETELGVNMTECIPGGTPNLLGYWELKDGGGQIAVDKTGTADGELGSTPGVDSSDPSWTADCCISCCVIGDPCWNVFTICDAMPPVNLDTVLCAGATIGGTWSGPGVTGSTFDPSGLSGSIALTYTLGVAPCDTLLTQIITVLNGPVVDAGVDLTVCDGTAVTLTAYNPSGAVISWDNAVVDGVPFTPSVGTHVYTLTAAVIGGTCFAIDAVTITVAPLPIVAFSVDSIIGCNPFTVSFSNSSTLSSSCFWEFGDGETSTVCGGPTHTYNSAGNYDITLTVTSADGCVSSATYPAYISVVTTPIAAFTPSTYLVEGFDTEVEFTNTSLYADSYTWNFGDGTPFSNVVNPTHIYSNEIEEIYEVMLIASKNYPVCSDTAITFIHVKDALLIYVPNAITLDGNAFNNTFLPIIHSGVDYYDYHLTIFNRWGEPIFESFNYDMGWNGEYGDKGIIQDGTYIWQIEFKETGTDKRQSMRGHVTVIR